jgi:16S rRNA (guanine527-N7)-methyltransferase
LNQLRIWNQHMNLTGLSSLDRIVRELVLDSLIPVPFLPDEGELLDVGSGAGFPAVPLKICKPNLGFHLLEASGKKVSFLKQVVRLTRVAPVRIDQGRIEADRHLLRTGGYHVITARGVAKLSQVVQWCAPHLGEKGILLNFQGSQYRGALGDGSSVLEANGLALHHTVPYRLPGVASLRHLLIIGRVDSEP